MFDFNELKKIKKYNYKNFILNLAPHKNKIVISEKSFDNILSGIICLVIGYLLSLTFMKEAASLASNDGINVFGISTNTNMGLNRIFLIIVPLILLIYLILTRKKSQTGYFLYSYMLFSFILVILLLFRIITWIGIFNLNHFDGIMGFISIIICFLGYVFVFVGIIDFLIKLKQDYFILTNKPKNEKIKTSMISVDDVSMHN